MVDRDNTLLRRADRSDPRCKQEIALLAAAAADDWERTQRRALEHQVNAAA